MTDTLRNNLEALLDRVLAKAYSTCGGCGHQIYKLDEPLETLNHPTWSRLTEWLHAGFDPTDKNGYWCDGGYTSTCRPCLPIITVEDIQDILNHKESRCSKTWVTHWSPKDTGVCDLPEDHSVHSPNNHTIYAHKFEKRSK